MLLNPKDFHYDYFHQKRGDGLSGAIHIGTPKTNGFCRVLVKDLYASDAINEYLGCNIGQRIGVNTPRAWLFKPPYSKKKIAGIDFSHAVGIEYLENLGATHIESYENKESTVQTIQGRLLHILMDEGDVISFADSMNRVYTFDFADGLFPPNFEKCIGTPVMYMRFSEDSDEMYYERIISGVERSVRDDMRWYLEDLKEEGISEEIVDFAFSSFKERFMSEYVKNQFSDLFQDIEVVFSGEVAVFTTALLKSAYNAMIGVTAIAA